MDIKTTYVWNGGSSVRKEKKSFRLFSSYLLYYKGRWQNQGLLLNMQWPRSCNNVAKGDIWDSKTFPLIHILSQKER